MKKGFILLLTVLIVFSLLGLSLGVGILVLTEIKLSGTGRESQVAFYAADAGFECALYWNLKKMAFNPPPKNIICANWNALPLNPQPNQYEFNLIFENNSCAKVLVDKSVAGQTTIESLGTNKCPSGSERSVERGIRITLGS